MRYLLFAILALPVFAQAPDRREVPFRCSEGYCLVPEKDWQWVMESMAAKDEALKTMAGKCGWKKT